MKKRIPVVAIFDIGKTNKKLLVFNEQYQVVKEELSRFDEIVDDDGFPCEDLQALSSWILLKFSELKNSDEFQLKAVNFSTYGASVVYVDAEAKPVGYLYNYLKPYPEALMQSFCSMSDSASQLSLETCSPIMGHLNAGMQLYWMKHEKPALFEQVESVLHFPQYLSFLITKQKFAEATNVGCHSAMWNFREMKYHQWLKEEKMTDKLSAITPGDHTVTVKNERTGEDIAVGIGLHDSSAAVIPYLQNFLDPFMILSTGTWMISLNPFNKNLAQSEELPKGCLSYLSYACKPVKAAMLFSGNDHDKQVQRIAEHFNVSPDFYKTMEVEPDLFQHATASEPTEESANQGAESISATTPCRFQRRSLQDFPSFTAAYLQLVVDMINQQQVSSGMVLKGGDVKNIYVDGGFSGNELYMQLLADAFPDKEVYAASMMQGTALGAALALHLSWNPQPLPKELIQLKRWRAKRLLSAN